MINVITFSKPKSFIGFKGITEASETDPNEVRQMTAKLRQVINQVFNPRAKKGKPLGYNKESDANRKGEDDYGTFQRWVFPVFTRNKDAMTITVKVWTGEEHGGSCIMWCQPPYQFTDGSSAVQFATQLEVAVEHAITMMKRWTRKANA